MYLDYIGAELASRQDAAHARVAQLASLAGRMTAAEIAAVMGVSKRAVESLALRNGISLQARLKHWTPEEIAILRRNAAAMTSRQLAALLPGRSATAIRRYAAQNGISLAKRGERHHRTTVPDADVELCRALHDEGLPVSEIARKMELKPETVRHYVNYNIRV